MMIRSSRSPAGRENGKQGHAAVDEQCGSDHVIGVVRRKPDGGTGDVDWLSDRLAHADDLPAARQGLIYEPSNESKYFWISGFLSEN